MGMTIKEALKKVRPALGKRIDHALSTNVADAVKRRESYVINDVVYSALTPVSYKRRGGMYGRDIGGEGLGDIINMEHTVEDGVLTVTNETPPNPYLNGRNASDGTTTTTKPIAALVEYGIHNPDGYGYDYAHVKPRPFTKETIESLKRDKIHIKKLKIGLRQQGLKVK